MVDGMMNPEMVDKTVDIMRAATENGVQINVIVNNRAGGNASLIAQQIARQSLEGRTD